MARLATCCGDTFGILGGYRHFALSTNPIQASVSPCHQPETMPQVDWWNSVRRHMAPWVPSDPGGWQTHMDLDATPNHLQNQPEIPWDPTSTRPVHLHRPELHSSTCPQLAVLRALGLSLVGETWIWNRLSHWLHTQRWLDWHVCPYCQPDTGHYALRWWELLPPLSLAPTHSTAWNLRRHDRHSNQPTIQPQWTTSQRQGFYTSTTYFT